MGNCVHVSSIHSENAQGYVQIYLCLSFGMGTLVYLCLGIKMSAKICLCLGVRMSAEIYLWY